MLPSGNYFNPREQICQLTTSSDSFAQMHTDQHSTPATPTPFAWLMRKQQKHALMTPDRLYTIKQARALLGNPCATTVRRWLKVGILHGTRIGPRGYFRIPQSEIERVRATQGR